MTAGHPPESITRWLSEISPDHVSPTYSPVKLEYRFSVPCTVTTPIIWYLVDNYVCWAITDGSGLPHSIVTGPPGLIHRVLLPRYEPCPRE